MTERRERAETTTGVVGGETADDLKSSKPRELPRSYSADDELTSQTILAVLGNSNRGGEWEPADITRVLTLCGSVRLDFRRALLPLGTIEVQVFSLLGSVKLTVPEGVDVDVTGSTLLGNFKQSAQLSKARRFLRRTLRAAQGNLEDDPFEQEEEPPLIRVSGLAVCGSVKVLTP